MIVDIEIDAVEYTLPVELHDEILEPNEFFGHYPPPFLGNSQNQLSIDIS